MGLTKESVKLVTNISAWYSGELKSKDQTYYDVNYKVVTLPRLKPGNIIAVWDLNLNRQLFNEVK